MGEYSFVRLPSNFPNYLCATFFFQFYLPPPSHLNSKKGRTDREPLPSQSPRQRPSTIQKPLGQVHCTVRLYSWNVTLLARSESATPRHSPHTVEESSQTANSRAQALETFPSGRSSFRFVGTECAQFVFKGDESPRRVHRSS